MIEILIAILIAIFSLYIIYKNIKNSNKGKCNCSTCTKNCNLRRKDDTNKKKS